MYTSSINKKYLLLLDLEIAVHHARKTRMHFPLQRYFNSTLNRNAFARLMCKAAYLDKGYSIKQICDEIVISRMSCHTMIRECLAAGYIIKHGEKSYIAGEELVSRTEDYMNFRLGTKEFNGLVKYLK